MAVKSYEPTQQKQAPEPKRTRWRQALFTEGADAFARSFPHYLHATFPDGAPPVYVCPLCLRAFPIEAIAIRTLTTEHAPPKCVGGPELLLTCSDCNNLAGRWLDVAMLKGDRPVAILRGEDSEPHFIKFGINGSPKVTAAITASAGGRSVKISERKFNNPKDYDAFIAESERTRIENTIAQSEMQVSFDKDRHFTRRARVGWLRAAYLIAFAAFGYRYAFGPALDRVRDQISRYDDDVIPSFAVLVPEAERHIRRIAVQHDRNAELRGVAVQFGWHVVFLPLPTDTEFYVRFHRYRQQHPERCEWTARHEYVWPSRPMYGGDQQNRQVIYGT
jgi:hypothetical protein